MTGPATEWGRASQNSLEGCHWSLRPTIANDNCSGVEPIEEGEEGARRCVGDDAVPEEMERLGIGGIVAHPAGSPIIQATNAGFRRAAPIPVAAPEVEDPISICLTATSVKVAPLCLPLSGVLSPAVPDAFAS